MSTKINKQYRRNAAYVRVAGYIPGLETRQFSFELECRIDTGFDGGIFIPSRYKSDLDIIGVEPSISNVTLADGSKIAAYICAAYILKMDKCAFLPPGKPIEVIICGIREGQLLGMDTLKYCTAFFDGINQNLTIELAS